MAGQELGGRRVVMEAGQGSGGRMAAGQGSGGRRATVVAQEREELDVEGGLDLEEALHLAVVFPKETSIRKHFLAGDIRPTDALTMTAAVSLAGSTVMANESAVEHYVHAAGIMVLLDAAVLPHLVISPRNKPLLRLFACLAHRIAEHAAFVGGSFAEKGELLRDQIIRYTTASTILPHFRSREYNEKLQALLENIRAEIDSILNDPPAA